MGRKLRYCESLGGLLLIIAINTYAINNTLNVKITLVRFRSAVNKNKLMQPTQFNTVIIIALKTTLMNHEH